LKFVETPLAGAFIVEIERREDERGFFARTVCVDEFAAVGLNGAFVQQSISWNPHAGTLRGLHFQVAPHEEEKLVRVTRGAIFDVIVDLRADSPTSGRTWSVELAAESRAALYIPKGFAHGFQTLTPETEVFYEMTVRFHPNTARGIRWNDPELGIVWPATKNERLVSQRDNDLPMLAAWKTAGK
jgi:dTDP-4-dehydrorhamnose 3,5-epimerase